MSNGTTLKFKLNVVKSIRGFVPKLLGNPVEQGKRLGTKKGGSTRFLVLRVLKT